VQVRAARQIGSRPWQGRTTAPKMEAISSSHPIDFTLKSAVNNNNLDDSYIYQRHSSPSSSPNASRSPSPAAPPIKSAPTGLNLLIGKPSSNSSAFRIVTPKGKNEGELLFAIFCFRLNKILNCCCVTCVS
jgi:hypothetical protein